MEGGVKILFRKTIDFKSTIEEQLFPEPPRFLETQGR